MKAGSGRLGQYKILITNKSIEKHLLEMKLFSKENLLVFIESHQRIIIKPVSGAKQIFVSYKAGIYYITANSNLKQFKDFDKLYQHLHEIELTDKYYIMQPNNSDFSVFDYVITFHRKTNTSSWCLQSIIENEKYSIVKVSSLLIKDEVIRLANTVAKELGNCFVSCNTIVIKISYDENGDIWIQDSILHFQKSKWSQYHTLSQKKILLPNIPDTEYVTFTAFKDFLKKYDEVIIKPCYGKEGFGIAQIVRSGESFEIHHELTKMMKNSVEDLYNFIEENFLSENEYIIQQRIALATIHDSPIDVRVITQKNKGNWSITGELVKVAGKGFIITNASQKVLQFEEAMVQSTIESSHWDSLQPNIEALCISAANQLEKYDPDIKIIGFDIGITNQGEVWLIEGNYFPNCSMFRSTDKEVYLKILKAMKD